MNPTKYFIHLMSDNPNFAEDGSWLKIDAKGWYKTKFPKATAYDTEEQARTALRMPVFSGISGALMILKLEISFVGKV